MPLVDTVDLTGSDAAGCDGLNYQPVSKQFQLMRLGPGQRSAETLGNPFPGPCFTWNGYSSSLVPTLDRTT